MKLFPLPILLAAVLSFCPLKGEEVPSSSRSVEVGLSVQLLHPDNLPGFAQKLTAAGPLVGIPIGNNLIDLQALYGSQDNNSFYLFEAGYRLCVNTPYFSGFGTVGGHFIKHTRSDYEHLGVNFGMGISYLAVDNVEVRLGIKIYFQDRRLVTIGGGFSYFL